MNGNYSTTAKAERLSDSKTLEFQWKSINWNEAETYINRLQVRIAKATGGKKAKRPLGIPCMYDRAMQALYALALDPVSEVTADTKSFGFRKGRSCQDACEYIFTALSRKVNAEWVLEGDIKGCFDHISHEWLIDNIPMDKSVLKQFLKAGFVFENELFPMNDETPQGGVISPILANMTLDGMQEMLVNHFDSSAKGEVSAFVHNNLVRYADDFVVTVATKEIAEEAKELIREFLKT